MSKLFTLREWLSLDQTAKHLTTVFNEEVGINDVLVLALERRLTLSLRIESSFDLREATPINLPTGTKLGPNRIKTMDGQVFELSDKIIFTSQILDLPMIGGEQECIKSYEWHNDTSYCWAFPFDEIFLKSESGKIYVLVEPKEKRENDKFDHPSNYDHGHELPKNSRIVVKTKYIRAITENPKDTPSKELSKNSEKAYLNIIGAMLELLKNPRPGRDVDAAIIRELVDNYSDKYGISESNLERKFPLATRSLSSD